MIKNLSFAGILKVNDENSRQDPDPNPDPDPLVRGMVPLQNVMDPQPLLREKANHDELRTMRIEHATSVATHKELRLQAEAELCRRVIQYRGEQTGRTIAHLMGLSLGPAGAGLVARLVSQLNQHAAALVAAKDEVDALLQEQVRRLAADPDLMLSLDYDLRRVELPALGGELAPLLLSVSIHPSPPAVPFPGFGAPSVPPPGYLVVDNRPGAPPGLPPVRPNLLPRPSSFGKQHIFIRYPYSNLVRYCDAQRSPFIFCQLNICAGTIREWYISK